MTANWLFGAPAAELPVDGSLLLSPRTTLAAFKDYRFGRYDDESQSTAESIASGQTDADGNFSTEVTLPDAETLGQRPVEAKVVLDVREGAGRPVERSQSTLILPDQPIIGIRPLFEDDTVADGSDARFALIAVGPDQQPAAAAVQWEINRVETHYEWYSLGGQWQWETTTTRQRVAEGSAEIGETPVEIAGTVGWGSYELVARTAAGAVSSTSFYAGWGFSAGAGSDTPDRLKVALDKPAYRSGDTANVTVEAIADGQGIVSVMSSKLVSQQIVPLKAGDNVIALPVTDDWGAGVYVSVSAIRPISGIEAGDRMPVRALGIAHAAVDPGQRQLQASLTVPAETNPRQSVPVTLKVEGGIAGETVHATIAAVDQGILNLTGFTPPDPSKHYFGQRRLGVGLRDLYGRLILPSGAADGTFREGGDAQVSGTEAPPPTEKLMSWFSGPLTVGADGTVTVDLPIGDFNGQIRVMAVVWSETGIGQSDATILSRDPVVMTVTAPAFLAPGDQAQIGLRLTHASGPAGDVRVALAQAGGEAGIGFTLPQDSVTLTEKGEAKLSVPLSAGEQTGLAEMRLTLTTPDGTALTKDIAISVAMNEPDIQRQDRLAIAPGTSLGIPPQLTDGLLPGAAISVAVGNYGRLDVAGALARLERYPYGCTEQITSIAMPLLYLPRLSALENISANNPNPTSIEQAIALILTRQSSSGGFGLWSADRAIFGSTAMSRTSCRVPVRRATRSPTRPSNRRSTTCATASTHRSNRARPRPTKTRPSPMRSLFSRASGPRPSAICATMPTPPRGFLDPDGGGQSGCGAGIFGRPVARGQDVPSGLWRNRGCPCGGPWLPQRLRHLSARHGGGSGALDRSQDPSRRPKPAHDAGRRPDRVRQRARPEPFDTGIGLVGDGRAKPFGRE
ncbi:alpha-2-macroglobulin family protein [Paracoccus cavernae]|uniref:Alpha-2-macroglobulin family protein n=1 Tax=Paracoccus cavernae TaxID=1571207 RepID=A0ABT8DBH1_9RHOB|nr:alpha-2-macroglobulin family protein [Paracoccus cavernae]